MNNSDKPAMPQSIAYSESGQLTASYDFAGGEGLTKREYVKAHTPAMPEWFHKYYKSHSTLQQ